MQMKSALYVECFYRNKEDKEDNTELKKTYEQLLAEYSAEPNHLCKKGLAYVLRIQIIELVAPATINTWRPTVRKKSLIKEDNMNFHEQFITLFYQGTRCYLLYSNEYLKEKKAIEVANGILFPVCSYDHRPLFPFEKTLVRTKCRHGYHAHCFREMVTKRTNGLVLLTEKEKELCKVVYSICAKEKCDIFSEEEIKQVFEEKQFISLQRKRKAREEAEKDYPITLSCCSVTYPRSVLNAIFKAKYGNNIYTFTACKAICA